MKKVIKLLAVSGLVFSFGLPQVGLADHVNPDRGVMVPIPGGDEGREAYQYLIGIGHNGQGEFSDIQRLLVRAILDKLYDEWKAEYLANHN